MSRELGSELRKLGGCLILLSGLPGAGKSRVAAALSETLGALWLCTDKIRESKFPRAIFGMEGKYSKAASEAVYVEMALGAEAALFRGENVVVDGTFLRASDRARIIDIAHRLRKKIVLVRVHAEDRVIRARLFRRKLREDAMSEADLAVYEAMKEKLRKKEDGFLDLLEDPLVDPSGKPIPFAMLDTETRKLETRNIEVESIEHRILSSLLLGRPEA